MGALRLRDLAKSYKVYRRPSHRLWEWLSLGAAHLHQPLWVLRGVDLDVESGEAVGIVGANGAGKSTLLKLVKGTLRPSTGSVHVEGVVAALELGLGFEAEFSGYENLFTAGALLGHSRERVLELLPAIESFAEIGAHLREPVRTYSAGMQLRLAFSLATAVRPDVLLIDEALAVGDVYFQQKCISRIRGFREAGTTLLLVSHDPAAITTLCDRAVLLDEGVLVRRGSPADVLEYYNAMMARRSEGYAIRQGGAARGSTRSGDQRATIEVVTLHGPDGPSEAFCVGAPMRIEVEGIAQVAIEDLTVGLALRDRLGNEIFGTNTHHLLAGPTRVPAGARFRCDFELPVNLGPGSYSVTLALHAGRVHLEGSYDWWDNVCVFQVIPGREPTFQGTTWLPVSARVALV